MKSAKSFENKFNARSGNNVCSKKKKHKAQQNPNRINGTKNSNLLMEDSKN